MRPVLLGFATLTLPAFIFVACSQDPISSATGSAGATTGSGTGGAPNCDGIVVVIGEDAGNPCDECLHKKCCAQVAACADKFCNECVNLYHNGCGADPHVKALNDCIDLYCFEKTSCNPGFPPFTSSSGTGGSGGTSSSASSG